MTIHSVSWGDMGRLRRYGLGGNAQFVNCDWVLDLPLVPLSNLFYIQRGMRRGWDTMFYPAQGHGIEKDYIRPVLKSSTDIDGFVASAKSDAFACSLSVDELQELGHTGALDWINRFKTQNNTNGRPLVEALKMAGLHWYEMTTDSLAELVMPLNYGDRLYVAKVDTPSFVNQRLISLNSYEGVDIDLCHALLNSAISMFIVEGMGFGRGLGVLDLSKNRVEDFMHILDPTKLNERQKEAIKTAFKTLLKRNVQKIADELEREDRKQFDEMVIAAFGLAVTRLTVYDNLLALVGIRQAALTTFLE